MNTMTTGTKTTGTKTGFLIHYTSTRAADLRHPDSTAIHASYHAGSVAELLGFLLSLPGDGTFVVTALTEL